MHYACICACIYMRMRMHMPICACGDRDTDAATGRCPGHWLASSGSPSGSRQRQVLLVVYDKLAKLSLAVGVATAVQGSRARAHQGSHGPIGCGSNCMSNCAGDDVMQVMAAWPPGSVAGAGAADAVVYVGLSCCCLLCPQLSCVPGTTTLDRPPPGCCDDWRERSSFQCLCVSSHASHG
jgi:hypothetical protein